jgi:hypothetical protein
MVGYEILENGINGSFSINLIEEYKKLFIVIDEHGYV